jgi:hypothetical protein
MSKGTGRLAGANGGVDPLFVKEALGDFSHFWREIPIGGQHRVPGFGPGNDSTRGFRKRRIAIPEVHLLHAEPFRLHLVVAMREARIGFLDGGCKRVDYFALDAVRQVAAVGNVFEAAPAIGDILVLGERIGDERKDADVGLEGFGERHCRLAAHFRILFLQHVQRHFQRQLLAVDLEAQFRHRLIEETVEGGS